MTVGQVVALATKCLADAMATSSLVVAMATRCLVVAMATSRLVVANYGFLFHESLAQI